MRKMLVVGGAVIIAALVVVMVIRRAPKETDDIKVSGTIETTVTALSFKQPGRVRERLVDEGQKVVAGQVVARLENDEVRQELAGREADLAAAQAALAELQAGSRVEEIAQAEAAVGRLKAESRRAVDEYLRSEQLFKRDVVAKRDLEQALAARDSSAASLREASERLRQVRAGARSETRQQARARLKGAEAVVSLARTRLEETTLLAPTAGIVLSKNIEAGEQVAPGTPVVTIGRLENVWIRGYVPESDLPRIRLGQKARVTVDGLKGRIFEGRLEFIAQEAEFTPKNVQTEKERVRLVYRVKVTVPNPDLVLKPGMPADALIETGARVKGN
ncbi:MAG: efflux RND transporter periplasmic adaptor subunit [Verrucomicrobia bacterium]|nr:efflux RND transporter periplasmic adaptor subunit [Deltaproteobacteria bacterium]